MFERTLTDLIRGIRANKKNETKFINSALEEIRKELKTNDIDSKANAISKLCYLQMMGYDIGWASFNVIEVMASPKFTQKRTGYLTACQSFSENTDVLMLATNLIKKDMSSASYIEAGVALNGLANFMTTDLARDLCSDVVAMMSHSRPYIRKKATLAMYKIFLRYPDALRPSFPRLKEKLTDSDPAVMCAAVNVICELARKNPQNYLPLAPMLYKILTTSNNNWMLIKIVKLFSALCPLEPRLAKKLVDPLANIINTTPAMSLLYECISTVTNGMLDQVNLVKLCVSKLRLFIDDADQNLKYLGLLTLGRFIEEHPKIVAEHRDIIMKCVDDPDVSIRKRALDLLVGMVTKKNLPDIVKKLLSHLDLHTTDLGYRDDIVTRIVAICSQNGYQHVTDFEWYYGILVHLCKVEGITQGAVICSQLLDVAIRVKVIRPLAVKNMVQLLRDDRFFGGGQKTSTQDVLYAAGWIVGEYASLIDNQHHQRVAESLLNPNVSLLPAHIQAIYVQNILKIVAIYLQNADPADPASQEFLAVVSNRLTPFSHSGYLEVQERACVALALLKIMQSTPGGWQEMHILFDGELNPVAPKAQKKVPVPEGLDLEEWIHDPLPEEDEISTKDLTFSFGAPMTSYDSKDDWLGGDRESSDEDEKEKRRQERVERSRSDPYMLSGPTRRTPAPSSSTDDVDNIPMVKLEVDEPIKIKEEPRSDKKSRRSRRHEEEKKYEVYRDSEMPEGASLSDEEGKGKKKKKQPEPKEKDALDIDLSTPLRADEQLPTIKAYMSPMEVKNRELQLQKERDEQRRKREEQRKKDEAARKEKSKSSSHSSRSERDKDSERRHRSSKDDRKSKDKDEKSAKESSKSSSKSSDAREPAKNTADDLLAFLDTPAASKDDKAAKSSSSSAAKSSSEKASSSSSSRSKSEGKEASRHSHSHRSSHHHHHHKERSSRSEKDDRHKSSGEEKDKKATSRPAKELYEAVEEVPEKIEFPMPVRYKPIAQDNHIKLTCEIQVDGNDGNSFTASLVISNATVAPISSMEFSILESLNVRLKDSDDGALRVPFGLPGEQANAFAIRFTVKSIMQPQSIKGSLTYITNGSESHKIDFKLPLPCSSFIVPERLDNQLYAGLLEEPANFPAFTTKVIPNIGMRTPPSVAEAMAKLLHMHHVESVRASSSFYGRSIQDHHIAVLLKVGREKITYDIKGPDTSFVNALATEVADFFAPGQPS